MAKITLDVILKIADIIGTIAIIISDTIKGRNKNDGTGGSEKK